MSNDFPQMYEQLQATMGKMSREMPATLSGFVGLHKGTMKDGALPTKVKEMMALSIAIVQHCEGCIAYHTHDALRAGATKAEVLEAIGVAVLMGGGPAMVNATEAYQALEQFSA